METNALTPMTELEAINDMLSLISESPVASIEEADGVVDAQLAVQLLRRTNRDVQEEGWHWNSEYAMRFAPNNDGEIVLPTNTIKLTATSPYEDLVFRSGKIWDRKAKTFALNRPVLLDLTLILPFEDIPQVARTYVATLAGRKYENRMKGENQSYQINERDVIEAKADLIQDEADNTKANVVRDSFTVRRITVGNFGLRREA